jgi:3',5'-cyclic AMP phosphodiesterase CpdA
MMIAHLSDLHLGLSPSQDALVEQQLQEIERFGVEHLVISGDLSQHGHPGEFASLLDLLWRYSFLDETRLTVIPGNHDLFSFFFQDFQAGSDFYAKWRQIPRMAKNVYRYDWTDYAVNLAIFHSFFSPVYQDIITLDETKGISYPFIKILHERVALIAFESNRLLPQIRVNPVCCNGLVDLASAGRILAHPILENKFKIALLHHHLLPERLVAQRMGRWYAAMTRILNRNELIRLFERSQVDLILQGHYHHHAAYTAGGTMPVLNSGDCGRWHLIEIDEHGMRHTSMPSPSRPGPG